MDIYKVEFFVTQMFFIVNEAHDNVENINKPGVSDLGLQLLTAMNSEKNYTLLRQRCPAIWLLLVETEDVIVEKTDKCKHDCWKECFMRKDMLANRYRLITWDEKRSLQRVFDRRRRNF